MVLHGKTMGRQQSVYRIIGEGDPEPVDSKKTVTREEVA